LNRFGRNLQRFKFVGCKKLEVCRGCFIDNLNSRTPKKLFERLQTHLLFTQLLKNLKLIYYLVFLSFTIWKLKRYPFDLTVFPLTILRYLPCEPTLPTPLYVLALELICQPWQITKSSVLSEGWNQEPRQSRIVSRQTSFGLVSAWRRLMISLPHYAELWRR